MTEYLTTTTEAGTNDLLLHKMVSARMAPYYEKMRVFSGLIGDDYTYLVPEGSYSVEIGQDDTLVFGLHTQATHYDAEQFLTSSRTLTPVTFGTSVLTSWEAFYSQPVNLAERYAKAAGTAFAYFEDSDTTYGYPKLYLEATATTHELGADGTPMSATLINAGLAALMTSGAPGPYNLVLDPIQVKELYNDSDAKSWLRMPSGDYAATVGVNPDRYVGQIYGVHCWRGDAMIENSGLFAILFGHGALAKAYKMYSSPLNPTPAELHVEVDYDSGKKASYTNFTINQHKVGAVFTATTNSFMVALKT